MLSFHRQPVPEQAPDSYGIYQPITPDWVYRSLALAINDAFTREEFIRNGHGIESPLALPYIHIIPSEDVTRLQAVDKTFTRKSDGFPMLHKELGLPGYNRRQLTALSSIIVRTTAEGDAENSVSLLLQAPTLAYAAKQRTKLFAEHGLSEPTRKVGEMPVLTLADPQQVQWVATKIRRIIKAGVQLHDRNATGVYNLTIESPVADVSDIAQIVRHG